MGDAGCSVGKDGKVTDDDDDDEEEEEEWKEDEGEETDGSRAIHRKHEWKLVAVWQIRHIWRRRKRIGGQQKLLRTISILRAGQCIHGESRA